MKTIFLSILPIAALYFTVVLFIFFAFLLFYHFIFFLVDDRQPTGQLVSEHGSDGKAITNLYVSSGDLYHYMIKYIKFGNR